MQIFTIISFLVLSATCSDAPLQVVPRDKQVIAGVRLAVELRKLSKKGNVSFVVESEPVEQPGNDVHFDFPEREPLDNRVSRIAEAFGYALTKRGNIFILKKLYRVRDDLPEVTLGEALAALHASEKLLREHSPQIPPRTAAHYPVAELTARVLSAVPSDLLSKQGLPVSALTLSQRDGIWRIARYFFVQRVADDLSAAIARNEPGVLPKTKYFHKQIQGVLTLGFESFGKQGVNFTPVDSEKKTMSALGVTITRGGTRNGVAKVFPDPDDTATPFIPPRSSESMPLSKAVERLGTDDKDLDIYQVDPIIADKSVMLIRSEASSRHAVMQALADVYGLRIRHDRNANVLTLRKVPIVRNITMLPQALKDVMPEPFLRAMYAHSKTKNTTQSGHEKAMDYTQAKIWIQWAVIDRVRGLVEPNAPAPDGQIVLSELEPQAKMAHALLLLMGSSISIIEFIGRPVPEYINNFEQMVLLGGTTTSPDGKRRMSFYFTRPDPVTGKLRAFTGFSNGRLPN